MEGTSATPLCRQFTSPWRNLAWSFRKSRDNWKAKYQKLKREQKRLQNQVRDVRTSRAHWRQRAEQTEHQSQALRQEIAHLQAQAAARAAAEKKG